MLWTYDPGGDLESARQGARNRGDVEREEDQRGGKQVEEEDGSQFLQEQGTQERMVLENGSFVKRSFASENTKIRTPTATFLAYPEIVVCAVDEPNLRAGQILASLLLLLQSA